MFTELQDKGNMQQSLSCVLNKRGESILIVDDDLMILELGKSVLGLYGYEVMTSSTRENAFSIIESGNTAIALAILDLNLKNGREGMEIATFLHGNNPTVKIIICSGSEPFIEALDPTGKIVDACLNKPYEMYVLAHEVERLLSLRMEEIS